MSTVPICLNDFEANAKQVLPRAMWDYYASGANEEETMQDNEQAYKRYLLRPRILRDVSKIDTCCTLLGAKVRSPICLAPSAMHGMAHEQGELATAAAAAKFGTLMTLSTYATTSLEDVRKVAGVDTPNWFQLYVFQNRSISEELIRRAEAAGYKALVLTVDAPLLGRRFANARNQFQLPSPLKLANFDPKHGITTGSARAAARLTGKIAANKKTFSEAFGNTADMTLCWEKDIAWMKSITRLPIVLKGIMAPEDAELACQYGVDAIWVSNHGGRQLDGALATIDALPEIVKAVKGRLEIYTDGGIRHGSDVFKALALGANAVFIGRPVLWGLAYGGEDGLRMLLEILQTEFVNTMALAGCANLAEINSNYVRSIHDIPRAKL
ncbi:Hydroxyacid oxidase 2 [Syncephalis fuscata]|nr:Hydroxyacid oxidase 2 [Syncephalis fuscata]